MVSPDDIGDAVICGNDPERIVDAIDDYADAGFTHVYIHQIGPDQEIFFKLFEEQIAPRLTRWLSRQR